jgi:hypothetical protein
VVGGGAQWGGVFRAHVIDTDIVAKGPAMFAPKMAGMFPFQSDIKLCSTRAQL